MKTNLGLDEFIDLGLNINKFPLEKSFGGFEDRNKNCQITKLEDTGRTTDFFNTDLQSCFYKWLQQKLCSYVYKILG